MMLSKSFALSEFVVSQTAARRGIDNTPPVAAVAELRRLADHVLQPLRDALQRPIVVSSGYRSPVLNSAVGGASSSAHMRGQAADITVPGVPVVEVARAILRLDLPVDQVIDEFGQWVHVAVAPTGTVPRRQQLTARRGADGRTVYSKGI